MISGHLGVFWHFLWLFLWTYDNLVRRGVSSPPCPSPGVLCGLLCPSVHEERVQDRLDAGGERPWVPHLPSLALGGSRPVPCGFWLLFKHHCLQCRGREEDGVLLCNLSRLFLRTSVFPARGLSSFLRRKDTEPPVPGCVSGKLPLGQRLACRGLPGTSPAEGGGGTGGQRAPAATRACRPG